MCLGWNGRMSSTSVRAECFCAPDILSMPSDIFPLIVTPVTYTGDNEHKLMSLTSPTSSASFGDLVEILLFTQCLKATAPKVKVPGGSYHKIISAPMIILLNYCWVIPEKAASQMMLKVWNSLAWIFCLLFCLLCERWTALPTSCSLFAGDFDLTALLITRWIGSPAA